MLGEHVSNEDFGEGMRINIVRSRNEDGLLGKPVNDDEDGCEARGQWEMLDEVHRDGIPRTGGDRKLLDESVGLVSRGLSSPAGGAGGDEVLNELPDSGPSVVATYELCSFVDSKVSCKEVIVFVLENP
jgi:hypothetical protein